MFSDNKSEYQVYVSPIESVMYYDPVVRENRIVDRTVLYKQADQELLLRCTRDDRDCEPELQDGTQGKTWAYLQLVNLSDYHRPDPCSTQRDPEAIEAVPFNNTAAVAIVSAIVFLTYLCF